MVNEYTEETKKYIKTQKLHAVEMKVHSCRKQKEPLLNIINGTKIAFHGPQKGNLKANDKKCSGVCATSTQIWLSHYLTNSINTGFSLYPDDIMARPQIQ
jgi:hypothetical protein